MGIGINPTVDFAFKMLLGNPAHPEVTIHFLNAVLTGQPRIAEVTILNPYLGKEADDDKLAVLDIRARDEHGRVFNIEMQTALPQAMAERLTYYVSYLYVDQLFEGDDYSLLRPAICICVLSQSMFPKSAELHSDFRLRERTGGVTLTDKLQIHLLELPKCRCTADNVRKASAIEQWAYFLRNAEQLTSNEIARQLPEQEFRIAAGVLEMIARSEPERQLYEARLKFQRDERARLAYAKDEGHQEGLREGLEQGLEQGLEKGRIAGRLEGEILFCQELLGLPPSSPEELAALSLDQLTAMAGELQNRVRQSRG